MNPEKRIAELEAELAQFKKNHSFITSALGTFLIPEPGDETGGEKYEYDEAKLSHNKYLIDGNRLKVYDVAAGTQKTLKGFYLDFNNMDFSPGQPNQYFLMLGNKPVGNIGSNRTTFTQYFTFLVMALDINGEIIVNPQGQPIVYEYLTPCTNTDSKIEKYFPS